MQSFPQSFITTINIQASAEKVWSYLTQSQLVKLWMLDDEKELEIITSWEEGSTLRIKGELHGIPFENFGIILKFNINKTLSYSHLSSISDLPDQEENYTLLEFQLTPSENQILLTLTISNFPTETIYRHIAFYWPAALVVLKNKIESN